MFGKLLIPLLIVAGYFLYSRRSSASTSTPSLPYGGTGRGTGGGVRGGSTPRYGTVNPMVQAEVEAGYADARDQSDEDWRVGDRLYNEHRADFDAYPAPLPPRLVAAVMARESGGRDVRSSIGEQGYLQLTPAEVSSAGGGDPHNLRDSIRMSQKLWWNAINANPQENPEDQTFVALASRGIGPGALRWLLSRIPAGETRTTDRVNAWLATTPERPTGIRQSDRKFTVRIVRALLRADRAEREGIIAGEGSLPPFGGGAGTVARGGTPPSGGGSSPSDGFTPRGGTPSPDGFTPAGGSGSGGDLTPRGGRLPSGTRMT